MGALHVNESTDTPVNTLCQYMCGCLQGQVYCRVLLRELAMNRADGRSIPIWSQHEEC